LLSAVIRGLGLLAGVAVLAACAAPAPVPVQKRYLWPAHADAARIEYLGFYVGDSDLARGSGSWFETKILGEKLGHLLFKKPFGVDARYDRVAVTDTFSRQVILFDLGRKVIEPLRIRSQGVGKAEVGLNSPTGVAFAGPDELWLADAGAREVKRFALDGRSLGTVGEEQLTRPTALAIDHRNRRAVVVDTGMHRLAVFALDGTFINHLGQRGAGDGEFNFPLDADFDSAGDLYVLDALNSRVQRFAWENGAYRYRAQFGARGLTAGSFQMAKSLAVSPSGHVYVTDTLADKVVVFDREGNFLLNFGGRYVADGGKLAPGGLNMPAGIAVDENDGIWIADSLNGMVHRFQYLNEGYLREHPILPEQVITPPSQQAPADSPGQPRALEGGK
jgi:sugar lactone lactonase YvrE